MYNILHTVYTEMYDMRSPMSLHNHAIFWEESGIAHVAAAMLQIRGKILKGFHNNIIVNPKFKASI